MSNLKQLPNPTITYDNLIANREKYGLGLAEVSSIVLILALTSGREDELAKQLGDTISTKSIDAVVKFYYHHKLNEHPMAHAGFFKQSDVNENKLQSCIKSNFLAYAASQSVPLGGEKTDQELKSIPEDALVGMLWAVWNTINNGTMGTVETTLPTVAHGEHFLSANELRRLLHILGLPTLTPSSRNLDYTTLEYQFEVRKFITEVKRWLQERGETRF